jgi:hypothetical protein
MGIYTSHEMLRDAGFHGPPLEGEGAKQFNGKF